MAKETRRNRLRKFRPVTKRIKTFYEEMSEEDQKEFDLVTRDILSGEIDSSNRTALARLLIQEFDIRRKEGAVTRWLKELLEGKE